MSISDEELKDAFRTFFGGSQKLDPATAILNPDNLKTLSIIEQRKLYNVAVLITEAERDLDHGDIELMRFLQNYLQLTRSVKGQGISTLITLGGGSLGGD